MTAVYDFTLPALDGRSTIDLGAYRDKPILIVNTASKCGFTPQYEGLQHIWSHYGKGGLAVVGIPSNDFGNQEPGDAASIGETCYRNYGVGFPVAEKAHVKGADAIPLFHWLATQGGFLSRPRWNFYKYIINRQGKLSAWFTPLTSPGSQRFTREIHRVMLDR
ncbi:glutathione peroxidase [Neoasaia chiangmaiensis NBRC 101099]|uniref:Glutathione peroxidase n=1 Tax=Neoasaia chiangmaiensis TaxID=320497 RepID=A0A1U9KN49_9PROT|nr:glutathione peroxidase [Neoasaia chiangmaiensis]AQS87213.1 glutathione peroxidase [Neoasaia chiangmaiensis]GBR38357.1 glutathione peroxidase [Neoasaia chiangmaiensis NBRC 101099]GEN15934.1 glutathione peroxidase [Neoasaia chiangmaiensis]